jgi:hypothetical protein
MPQSAAASLKALQAAAVGVPAGASAAGAPPAVDDAGTTRFPVSALLVTLGIAAAVIVAGNGGDTVSASTQH